MLNRSVICAAFSMCLLVSGCRTSQWSGTWQYDGDIDYGGDLHCIAKRLDEQNWRAQFTGNCGKDFSYKVTMNGSTEGDAVLFTGEADLGDEDGGLYQWTGRMESDKFTGKYGSATGKTGTFLMTKR